MQKSVRPVDIINVILSAIVGAVIGNSEAFRPKTMDQAAHCLLIVLLVIGFALNCQWTIIAFQKRKPGFAVALVATFLLLELALLSDCVSIQKAPGDALTFQFLQSGCNGWVLCGTFAALYVLNFLAAARPKWLEGIF